MAKPKRPSRPALHKELNRSEKHLRAQLDAIGHLRDVLNAADAGGPPAAAVAAAPAPADKWDATYEQLKQRYILANASLAGRVTRSAKMLGTPFLGFTKGKHDDFIKDWVIGWFGTTNYSTSSISGDADVTKRTVADHVDTILAKGGTPH